VCDAQDGAGATHVIESIRHGAIAPADQITDRH
jgi:hypothetical protein